MSAKILVIDDNPTNLKLVSDLLEFEGHMILKAVDAASRRRVNPVPLPRSRTVSPGLREAMALCESDPLQAELLRPNQDTHQLIEIFVFKI